MTQLRASVRAAVLVVGGLACAVGARAQTSAGAAGRTVWEGVYGASQADRGRALYHQRCSACHGDFLDGDGVDGRHVALSGIAFADNWESASVNDLFSKIGRTMPQDRPGTLTDAQALEAVAFLLQVNGFPSGASELRPTLDLAVIDIVGTGGPQPLRAGSGVRTVGCLTPRGDGAYTLTRASPLVRTKSPNASAGLDVERAKATPLGPGTVGLVNIGPGSAVRAGAKVEVKGVLSAIEPASLVVVTSVQLLDGACRE